MYLGYVGQGMVKPVDSKVKAMCNFPRPESKKQLMCFLGMVGYYRKFCVNFSTITEPLKHVVAQEEGKVRMNGQAVVRKHLKD